MNPTDTGKLIAFKRREKGLTQEQLAQRLGISNKTVSKWETGKCMPDYGIVKVLCRELELTVAELMEGKEREEDGVHMADERQMIDMLERIQRLEKQKESLFGMMCMTMGVAMLALSQLFSGTGFRDFISGVLLGLAVGEMLAGLYVMGRTFGKQ